MKTLTAKVGNIKIGSGHKIVVQSMCNTHTNDIAATVKQCIDLYNAGAELVRITVPTMSNIEDVKKIKNILSEKSYNIPIVADIHFSSKIAIGIAPFVEKVRINPGNFHKDHNKACEEFAKLVQVCKQYDTAIRIGINHGSLGERLTMLYGNTAEAMAKAAEEWISLCKENDFYNVVISLKASNTIVMVKAYRLLSERMKEDGLVFPLHLGVTEAGNGDAGRIKSCVGIASLLSEGIGNTIRVSLTEDPLEEIPVAKHIADRYDNLKQSSLIKSHIDNKTAYLSYRDNNKEIIMLDLACDFGKSLLDRKIDNIVLNDVEYKENTIPVKADEKLKNYWIDELLQACRRKFYRPEYIACPGCGRTMYNLEKVFADVQARTAKFKDTIIAVMGCIVNGPGEMADADWGYVGEGNKKVSIYKKHEAIVKHVDEDKALDILVELIENDNKNIKKQS